jgi:hypothetical protein
MTSKTPPTIPWGAEWWRLVVAADAVAALVEHARELFENLGPPYERWRACRHGVDDAESCQLGLLIKEPQHRVQPGADTVEPTCPACVLCSGALASECYGMLHPREQAVSSIRELFVEGAPGDPRMSDDTRDAYRFGAVL